MIAGRIDFFDDPKAPKANSMVPSANVVVANHSGEILMIRRSDNDNWALPGGAMDLGESMPDAAIRETLEETGVQVEITGIVGIYTDPRHVILYTSNGEARQEFSIVFTAKPLSGTPTPSDESREVRWIAQSELATLTIDRSMRMRIAHYLAADGIHLGWQLILLRGEHGREAERSEDELRNQAARISAWVEVYRKPDGMREIAFHVHNASDMPIYEAEIPLPTPSDEEQTEFVGLVPPGQTVRRAAPPDWLRSYVDPEPVQIEFLDSAGRRWTRNEQGRLTRTEPSD